MKLWTIYMEFAQRCGEQYTNSVISSEPMQLILYCLSRFTAFYQFEYAKNMPEA